MLVLLPLPLVLLVATTRSVQALDEHDYLSDVERTCSNLDDVQSVQLLDKFHSSYLKLNKCLRSSKESEQLTLCLQVEESCQLNGVVFSSLELIKRLNNELSPGSAEPVCTIEYSSRILRLHKRLVSYNPKMAELLRLVANEWSKRCLASLASRLLEVEKRASESTKYLNIILGTLRYKLPASSFNQLRVPVDFYVPILEDELMSMEDIRPKGGARGFEFKVTKTQLLAYEASRMSCEALKPYYLNILGSLGLVASSVGYDAPAVSSWMAASKDDDRRIQDWLLAALVCQSLSTVARVSTVNAAGKSGSRLLVYAKLEADVSRESERDTTFSSYHLTETAAALLPERAATRDTCSLQPAINRARNLRKAQLIEGPNKLVANAIEEFLDMNRAGREKLPLKLLALDPVHIRDDTADDHYDRDDEDEDEEEEEEEDGDDDNDDDDSQNDMYDDD